MPEPWFWYFAIFIGMGLLYDYWAFKTKKAKTLSTWFEDRLRSWPLMPFLVGILIGSVAGHLWWCYCG